MRISSLIFTLGILLLLVPSSGSSFVKEKEEVSTTTEPFLYTPKFAPLNIKQQMTLSPLFTPDNALDIYAAWLSKANTSIDIQNQYITQFDDTVTWDQDPNPIVREIVKAHARGVTVRVQVRGDSDSDDVTTYLQSKGIAVRWMGTSASGTSDGYLSATHNKLVIVDNKVILISSINFGKNAFTNNREAGMVIQNVDAATYFTGVFESDWADGEVPYPIIPLNNRQDEDVGGEMVDSQYVSHTNIPRANFTGVYNITLYVNPDNADEVIFKYLKQAKKSIYVSMYTISRPEFNNTLIELKKANPSIDIQVLISNRRVGGGENRDTYAAAKSLVDNFIPVYNSTKDSDKVNGFYHNKYWIIDMDTVFVYSGNWSPRSVTPQEPSYTSGDPNRDMGVAVHEAPDIAEFFKTNVWDKDVAVADPWELPIGIKQNGFQDAEVVSGTVTIGATTFGLQTANLSYRFGNEEFKRVDGNGSFTLSFDTTTLPNGVTSFEVRAESSLGIFNDKVQFTVANYPAGNNFRVLITELLPNPDKVSDAEGEFIEISNSFPFDVLISGWKFGTTTSLYTFSDGTVISAYSSIVIARSISGLKKGYGVTAQFEMSFSLTNTKGEVILYNAQGEIVDDVAYGTAVATDGSETLDAPGAEESLLREPMHIDTNTKADFRLGAPEPLAAVPNVPLGEITSESSLGTSTLTNESQSIGLDYSEIPVMIEPVILVLIAVPIIKKRAMR